MSNNNNNNNSPNDLMPPPLGVMQGECCCIACIFLHVLIGTMRKCKECVKYLHGVCSALEDDNDPSVGLGSNSVCHDCFGTEKNVQKKIAEGKVLWEDKLKADEEWETRKNTPGGMEKGKKTELKKKAAKAMKVKSKSLTKVKGMSKAMEAYKANPLSGILL
jgi:hypothetical protein